MIIKERGGAAHFGQRGRRRLQRDHVEMFARADPPVPRGRRRHDGTVIAM